MKSLLPVALSICTLCGFLSFGAEGDAVRKPEFSVAFTGAMNEGNTVDKSGNVAALYKSYMKGVGEYSIGIDGTVTRTKIAKTETLADGSTTTSRDEVTTAKNGKVAGKVLFDVTGPVSVYLDSSAFADEIANVDYRYLVGPGFSFFLIKEENMSLSFEFGLSAMWEQIGGDSEYYTTLRAAQIFEYAFAQGAKIFEKCEYLPALDDSDKYLINAEAGIDSPITGKLSLRISVKDAFNSMPDTGLEKNDISLNAGLVLKL